jgi:hypothetical protein
MSRARLAAVIGAGTMVGLAMLLGLPAVNADVTCSGGTAVVEARPPAGREEWCERRGAAGRPIRQGPYRAWYPNGRLKIEGEFLDGEKSGRWTFWHGNGLWPGRGQKKEEGEYRQGREQGTWTRWYSLGPKRDEGNYRDGIRQGRWTFWHELGQKAREGDYRDGREAGVWLRWSKQGEPCAPEEHGTPLAAADDRAGVSG